MATRSTPTVSCRPLSIAILSLVPTPSVVARKIGSLKPAALGSNTAAKPPRPASAPGRANVYAVGGIQVDETAASAAAAQQAGFTAAQMEGFERLVRRLAPQADLLSHGVPPVEGTALDRLVQSVDVEQERRSATRYIG